MVRVSYQGRGVDVGDIGGDAGGGRDIVEGEGGDEGVQLHEESQRLPDAAGRAEDGHLPLRLPGCGGVAAAAEELGGGSHHRRPHRCWTRRRERSGSMEAREGRDADGGAVRLCRRGQQSGSRWDQTIK